ncbi:MAG: hypothetical protein QNK04_26230 [Myxococcota bacterium]|nr:hypothetical protein [Myxococcota bacterium]
MTAIPAHPAPLASAAGRSVWVQSPGWDLFWMFSGIWATALFLVGWALQPVLALALALFAFDRLAAVFHAWSTTYMVLASPLLAEERRDHRWRFTWVPMLIAVGSLALGVGVAATQRFPADGHFGPGLWAFALYIGVFWVGHFWHFGNQDFGVLSLYRARAGQTRAIDRRVDKLYTVAMMYVIQPVVYLSVVTTTAFSELVWTLLPLTPEGMKAGALAAVVAAALLSAAAIGWELSKPSRSLPRLLYLFVCFLHPTLLYAAVAAGQEMVAYLYIVAYLWSHWLVAIGLVGRLNTRFYESRGDPGRIAVVRHAALLLFIGGLVYLATERHKEYLLFNTDGFQYKELLSAITPEQTLVIGLLLGFFLGEQLLHYYCDRCLFRFRHAGVRRRVAPLLLGDATSR